MNGDGTSGRDTRLSVPGVHPHRLDAVGEFGPPRVDFFDGPTAVFADVLREGLLAFGAETTAMVPPASASVYISRQQG